MNYKMVFTIVGRVIALEAGLMLVPLLVALAYGESIKGFIAAILAAAAIAALMLIICRTKNTVIFAKEGFASVSLAWVFISLIGAIPFTVEGEIPNYIDALFEIISGFTTTGASILTDVEAMSKGLLFWRSFTHWIGGMGILVLMMAVLPMSHRYSMHIMRAEVPGPTASKLVPKAQNTSMILYVIYVALTIIEVVFLICGGLPVYDAFIHAFGTAGTGGFGMYSASIGYYNSVYVDVVIGIFMILFGINFNIYFLLLLKKFKTALKNEEMLCYLGIVAFATVTIALNIQQLYESFGQSLRYSFFQVASIITTTGYATTDFNLWPQYSKTVLVVLMFIGACAGSTGGGIKVSRFMILFKAAKSEVKHLLRPHSYNTVKINGETVEKSTLRSTLVFFFVYIIIILISILFVSLENFDTETTVTSVIACVSNIGPGLSLVGPSGNFASFSAFSKLVLSACMLFGRLEIFPLLMLFSPYTWRRSSRF